MRVPGAVDVQTHFLPPSMVSALERSGERPRIVTLEDGSRFVEYGGRGGYPVVPEMVDLERKLEMMDASDVGYSVLSVNIPGLDWFDAADARALARDVNDELAEAMRGHPDRFGAFAALPMQDPVAAAVELERAMSSGLNGTMIYSNVAGRSLDDPAFRPVFEVAAYLGAPILLHPTYPLSASTLDVHAFVPVIGFLFDTTTAILRLIFDGVFDRHPDLKLILGHLGSLVPYVIGRIDYESIRIPGGTGALSAPPSEHIRRLYVDTVSGWSPAVRLAIDFFGADHLLFASDHPFWEIRLAHEALDALRLPEDQLEAIRSGNAARVLGLDDGV